MWRIFGHYWNNLDNNVTGTRLDGYHGNGEESMVKWTLSFIGSCTLDTLVNKTVGFLPRNLCSKQICNAISDISQTHYLFDALPSLPFFSFVLIVCFQKSLQFSFTWYLFCVLMCFLIVIVF